MRQSQVAPERLIPPGEGWVRFNEPRPGDPGKQIFEGAVIAQVYMTCIKIDTYYTWLYMIIL